MKNKKQPSGLEWSNETPVSRMFDDPYYSLEDGLAESRHVFLAGNNLPSRWLGKPSFTIAETGFGTGLNICAAIAMWRTLPTRPALTFVSFEAYPLTRDEMSRAIAPWPDLTDEREALLSIYDPAGGDFDVLGANLTLIIGDAQEQLPRWDGKADAWFLDGFAPAKNPSLWSEGLIQSIAAHTHPGGTCATFTAAGVVRRALSASGFTVEKRRGFGRKRDMTVGVYMSGESDDGGYDDD